MIKSILSGTLLMGSIFAFAQTTYKVDLKPFPKAEQGMKQVVIEVPHSEQDQNKKIEILVGKEMETDKCNRYSLGGSFDSKELQGWGYNYLTFKTNGNVASTRMVCADNSKISQFVTSQGYLMNYNGRMPIVLYIPDGYEAKFNIYTTDGDLYSAQEIRSK